MNRSFFLLILLLWMSIAAIAQVDTAWVRRYNGPSNLVDRACALKVDDSGNVYVTGYSVGNGTDYDYATIKYLPNGDTGWVRRYNGPANGMDQARDVTVDPSGNILVTGFSFGTGDSSFDYATIKYYSNGDTAWLRRYHAAGDTIWSRDKACALVLDNAGNIYVTGTTTPLGANTDYLTIKYKSNGDLAWVRRYDGPGKRLDEPTAIATDADGNIYVTGWSDGGTSTYGDYATIKYLPNGDTAWVRRYDGWANLWDRAYAITADHEGNVYVTGAICPGWYRDYATIKYYPNGDTAWVRTYEGYGNWWDYGRALAVDVLGNVYVTGNSWEGWDKQNDYTTIRYRANGDSAWTNRYDGFGGSDDFAYAIALDTRGNVYVTGSSYSQEPNCDYTTVKIDSSGVVSWAKRYDGIGSGDDKAWDIAVCGSGNVYVTGESYSDETDYDYVTIKYVESGNEVRDETGNRETPPDFALCQNHPNPFNESTEIEFTLAKSGFVSLTVHDLLGRKIRTLVSEHLPSGYKSVFWDGTNEQGNTLASGIYFYRMKTAEFSRAKKMLLLK